MSSTTIQVLVRVEGNLTDASSVVLGNKEGTLGLVRNDNAESILSPGAAFDHPSTGRYTLTFDAPENVGYTYYAKIAFVSGRVVYVERQSTVAESESEFLVTFSRARKAVPLAKVDDYTLSFLLEAATNHIEDWCGRSFRRTVRTETYSVPGSQRDLLLRSYPVTEINAVEIRYRGETYNAVVDALQLMEGQGEIVFSADYNGGYSDPADWTYSYFPNGYQSVTVTYTAGFSPIPAAVQMACVLRASELLAEMTTDQGMKSENLGVYSYTRVDASKAEELSSAVKGLVARYKEYRV